MFDVGDHIDDSAGPFVLSLEGLYVPSGRGSRAKQVSVVPLAESAGEILGALRSGATEVHRPTARQWRAQVIGVGSHVKAQQAEEIAVRWATRSLRWVVPIGQSLTYAEEGAVCEAACMASYVAR